MRDAGYNVTIQTYKFNYFAFTGNPDVERGLADCARLRAREDWNPGPSTGRATADLQPAGGIVIPPTPTSELGERLHRR